MNTGDIFWCTQPNFIGLCIYVCPILDDRYGDLVEIITSDGRVVRLNVGWLMNLDHPNLIARLAQR